MTTEAPAPLTVTDFAVASEILASKVFAQCGHNDEHWAPVTHDTLISLHGSEHFDRRRLENPLFRKPLLNGWEVVDLEPALSAQLTRYRASAGAGPVAVDLLELTRRSLLPVTAKLIGLDVEFSAETVDDLDHLAEALAPAAALRVMPEADQDRIRARAAEAEAAIRDRYFLPAWRRRLKLRDVVAAGGARVEERPADLLMTLAVNMPELPIDGVLREALLFIVASTDTTTLAVAATFFHIDEWLREHPEDGARLGDPVFLQRCAHESIRLHPPPPVDRVAVESAELRSGLQVQAGDRFAVDLASANRDVSIFGPTAAEFDPYRDTPSGVRPFAMGFGGGPHMCIGRMMATAVTPLTGADDHDESSFGTAVRVLLRLLAEGARIDAADRPVWRGGSLQERFRTFPIVLSPQESRSQPDWVAP